MGILRSFTIGVSGLSAAGQGMGVIGDNIANAGTNGFKSSRAEFQDVLTASLKGVDGGDQFGAGTKLGHIRAQMTQGDVTRTDSVTDLAISGDGMFTVEGQNGRSYTRDGSFHFDKEGQLTTMDGYRVLGFGFDEKGMAQNKLEPIKLGGTAIPARATKDVKLQMNFDSRVNSMEFNMEKPDSTSNFSNSMTVYDNVGTARTVTIYYNKTENNQWEYHVAADGKDVEGGKPDTMYEMANGKLIFNDKGQLEEKREGKNSFNFNKGASKDQKITFSWGQTVKEGGTGLDASTQYGSDSIVSRGIQDGSTAATLASLAFNDKGILTAVYNNGESRDIGQVAIAKFENNEGLFKIGKNLFRESKTSGQPTFGKPGESGRGEVLSKSIELSNVDIANEFVNLMTAQRNFQANAKTLTTADQMLQEVLQIKR